MASPTDRRRVDVSGSSSAGAWLDALSAALGLAGFDVLRLELDDLVRSTAGIVVLRGESAAVLSSLRALRDDGKAPDSSVVLVGTPEGTGSVPHGTRAFGADRVLAGDASFTEVIETLRGLGSATAGRAVDERDVSVVLGTASVVLPAQRDGSGSSPGTSSGGTGQLVLSASISEALRSLLYDADRRVFPDRAPVDVNLPTGAQRAAELVPDDVLELPVIGFEEGDRDGDLTFVGPSRDDKARSLAEAVRPEARRVPSVPPRAHDSEPPKTSPGTPTSISKRPDRRPSLELSRVVEGPRLVLTQAPVGELGPLGALRVIGQLALGRLDATLTLRVEGAPAIVRLVRGEIVGAGGEAFRVARQRSLMRLLGPRLGNDAWLDGGLAEDGYARQRWGGRADEEALASLFVEALGPFAIGPLGEHGEAAGRRLTQRSLLPFLFEVVQREVRDESIRTALVAPSDRLLVSPTPLLARIIEWLDAPREFAWLVSSPGSVSLDTLLQRGGGEPGLLQALYLVHQLGGFEVLPVETSLPAPAASEDLARRFLETLSAKARAASYYDVLGVPPDAPVPAIRQAHEAMVRDLEALVTAGAQRAQLRAVLDDALAVLANPRLGTLYRVALAG